MKVLSIGNSFSTDATRYLHGIAAADSFDLETVNLFIPSCTLDRHYRNMLSGERAYSLEYNGQTTGFFVSMEEALLSREWDVITLQQQSARSADWETFEPYITALCDYVKECAPKAKIFLHQTWPLEDGSQRLANAGYESSAAMFANIEQNYAKCREMLETDGLIPSGRALMALLALGVEKVHRDSLHTTKGLGRYTLGLLWYRMLTGRTVADNAFCSFDEPVSEEEIRVAKNYVDSVSVPCVK